MKKRGKNRGFDKKRAQIRTFLIYKVVKTKIVGSYKKKGVSF